MADGGRFSGTIFVAFMFIGLGIGMLFDEPGAGVIIGMGVGFIAGTLMREGGRTELPRYRLALPTNAPQVFMVGLGALFISWGVLILYGVKIPWDIVVAASLIVIGLAFLVIGTSMRRSAPEAQER